VLMFCVIFVSVRIFSWLGGDANQRGRPPGKPVHGWNFVEEYLSIGYSMAGNNKFSRKNVNA